MVWRSFAAALDAGTAVCAALNTAYFLGRLHDERRTSRLAAIVVLAVISFGALLEATVLLALATDGGPTTGSGAWAALRLLAFAGTAGVSALIARRMAAR
jgi:hypothetical protein